MKGINDILNKIMTVIEQTEYIPVDVVAEHRGSLMNMPLLNPTVTVGVKDITMETTKIRAYGGMRDGVSEYSVPVVVEIGANIHIPKDVNGSLCYDVLSALADGLFYDEELDVFKITGGGMGYNSTFLCTVLPVSIFVRDRVCGNTAEV